MFFITCWLDRHSRREPRSPASRNQIVVIATQTPASTSQQGTLRQNKQTHTHTHECTHTHTHKCNGEQTFHIKCTTDEGSPLTASGQLRRLSTTLHDSLPRSSGSGTSGSRSPPARSRPQKPCTQQKRRACSLVCLVNPAAQTQTGRTQSGETRKRKRDRKRKRRSGPSGSPVPQPDAAERSGSVSADKQTQVAV